MAEVNNFLDSFEEPNFQELLGGVDNNLVISFFNYFSRFEYALKRIDFKQIRGDYLIGADWVRYAEDEGRPTYPTKIRNVDRSVKYLCKFPVMRQRGDFSWEEKPEISPCSFSEALKQIPYVRNNLFHGGKYFRPVPARDEKLMNCSICLGFVE